MSAGRRRPAPRPAPPAPRPRRPRATSGGAGSQIKVRMYNVGFGDCFLLRLPTAAGERRMLVDCGFHSQGKGEFSDAALVEQITRDLDGAPLDVVVATHRHQDHISGFGETAAWKRIGVEEVWLPFTMGPAASGDPALRAWNGLLAAAQELLGPDGRPAPATAAALAALEEHDRAAAEFMLWNARSNAPGIQNLLGGLTRPGGGLARRRFLPEDGRFPSTLVTPALPGVTTYVLGPPKDPALRRARQVPPGWGVSGGPGAAAAPGGSPFGPEWRVPAERLPSRRPFQDRTLGTIRRFNDDLLHAAKAVDGFLNGESLVLVVELGSARLLLPGDAEVGTWSAILGNPDALSLAASATFLKVGHHGSHNATPLRFMREHLARRTPAVISTQQGPGAYRNDIPYGKLLKAMEEQDLPYVRSDRARSVKGLFQSDRAGWVDCVVPC